METCIFCKIVAKQISVDFVYEDDRSVAFADADPQAPLHLLVIPKVHVSSLHEAQKDHELVGHLLSVAATVAESASVSRSGYRVVTNIGTDGGQSVDHLHFHVLGGRHFSWPPG